MGEATSFDLLAITPPQDMELFKAKGCAFLRDHQGHIAIHQLRMNKPLTPSDLQALETTLAENGIGDAGTIAKAKEESQGLELFVRSLIGLDRGAAKEAFAEFLEGRTLTGNQIEFIVMIIDHLTEHGVMGVAVKPIAAVGSKGSNSRSRRAPCCTTNSSAACTSLLSASV